MMREVHYLFVLLLEVRAEEGEHQERWPKTEAPSVGLTKAPIILLHWLGWRACFEPAFERVWMTGPRPLRQVVLLALSSDRPPIEFRALGCVPGDHVCGLVRPQLRQEDVARTHSARKIWDISNFSLK